MIFLEWYNNFTNENGWWIDFEQRKLVETTKDGDLVYDLDKVLQDWNGVMGISFSIKLNQDIEPDSTEY